MQSTGATEKTMEKVLRRIAVIGDVHGEDEALEATLDFLRGQGDLDALLCTGDLPAKMGVGNTARCCELLKENSVYTIRGNHDRWAVEMMNDETLQTLIDDESSLPSETIAFLTALPKTIEFETPIGSLLLCHGVGTNDMDGIYPGGDDEVIKPLLKARRIYGKHRVMIAGHTHERMLRQIGTVLCINPGTLIWSKAPGFLIVDFERAIVTVYHIAPFVYTITEDKVVSFPMPQEE